MVGPFIDDFWAQITTSTGDLDLLLEGLEHIEK
jgi:hypothetical protein